MNFRDELHALALFGSQLLARIGRRNLIAGGIVLAVVVFAILKS